jgi:hypothetical protein
MLKAPTESIFGLRRGMRTSSKEATMTRLTLHVADRGTETAAKGKAEISASIHRWHRDYRACGRALGRVRCPKARDIADDRAMAA